MIEDPFLGQARDFINLPEGANTKEAISGKFSIGLNRAQKMVDALNTEIASAAKPPVAPINNTSATEQTNNIKNSSPAPAKVSATKAWSNLQSTNNLTGITQEQTDEFLKKYPGYSRATEHSSMLAAQAVEQSNIDAANKSAQSRGFASAFAERNSEANALELQRKLEAENVQRAYMAEMEALSEDLKLKPLLTEYGERLLSGADTSTPEIKATVAPLTAASTGGSGKPPTIPPTVVSSLPEEGPSDQNSSNRNTLRPGTNTTPAESRVPNIKTPGMSTSMFMADGEMITDHNNVRNVNASSSGYGSKSLGGINASTVSTDLSYKATGKQQLGTVKANPGLPKNTSATYGNTSAKIGNLSTAITPLSSTSSPQGNSSTPKGTHPNTGRPIYNTFEERQAARQRDVAAIQEKHKSIPKKPVFKYSPNKAGEVPFSLAHEEKGGLVRNRKLPKNIIATRQDATAETQAPKPKPITKTGKVTGKVTSTLAGVGNTQSGDRSIDAVKKLGASKFRPITSLHTQMTPSTDIARGFDGTGSPRPGTRSNIPFVSKYDRNFGQGPVPIYEEAKNGGTGGKLVGKPPSTVTTDLTQSTHYNEEQAATDRRDQAAARAKNPGFKRVDAAADAVTAAYLGLNTTIGSEKPIADHLKLGGRGKQAVDSSKMPTTPLKNAVNAANQVNNPLQSTSSRQVVPGAQNGPVQPVRTGVTNPSLGEMSDDFDRANSLVNPLAKELTGISNLGEADANAYGRAYNQSLVNNRIGRKAGFEDLKINDITLANRQTGALIEGKALANHTALSVAGYGSRSLTSGYGMGWGNAWRASRSEHAIRAISVVNPLSRGNMSIVGEALGRTTTLDRLRFKANPSPMNRFGAAASPLFTGATLAYGMYDNQDIGELATTLLLPAVALPSARVGIALGGMITPAKTAKNFGVIRGLGLAGGAVGGFVAGAAAVIGVSAGIRDVTSNTSSIRKMSKKIATQQVFVDDNNSRQSLTARQMSLNKLSRSGLNDRALLLSNEAAQLKGLL